MRVTVDPKPICFLYRKRKFRYEEIPGMDGCMARRLGFFLSHEERMRQTKLPKS
jgi:hypothetical protein